MHRRPALSLLAASLAVATTATAVAQTGTGARPAAYVIPGEKTFPEGIAREPGTSRFFITSTTDGTIFAGDLRTPQLTAFAAPGAQGRTTAIGLKADGRGNLVVAGGATGKIFVLSAKDGSTTKVLDTKPNGADTFLNDVVISRGYAYVTDSQRPVLYRVALREGSVGRLETFARFTGTPFKYRTGFNANGIAAGGDGAYLVVVQSGTGKLFRVDVRSRKVTEVRLGGKTVVNGDGLLLSGQTLYVARNAQERIVPVRLTDGGRRGVVGSGVTGPQLKYPTTLALDGSRLLAVNAQFDKRTAMQPPVLPFDVATIARPKAPSAGR